MQNAKVQRPPLLLIGTRNRWSPYLSFGPICVVFAAWGAVNGGMGAGRSMAWFLAGTFIAHSMEYFIHRYLFHRKDSKTSIFHLLHHQEPQNPSYLASPLFLVLPAFVVLLVLYTLISRDLAVTALLGAGTTLGYMLYEYCHYSAHFSAANWSPAAKYLKKYHLDHHFKDHTTRYGVSSPLWDMVMGTSPKN